MDELNSFLSIYTTSSLAELNEYNGLSGLQYWGILRPYFFCSSGEGLEHFLLPPHTKRRNRMSMAKLEKLAFVYINCSLLAEKDKVDYIRSYVEDEDEEKDEDGVGEETDLEVGLADFE
ncbi:hypothetical protein PHMEG_00028584 [Phytophthora megakarya]|uniref:HAT C-terminal dimerisation domain-containing protein n=1 Tax=Phytophthora megakarya TaxID=4795 RepID=A0A225V4N9_9STRA|nr:hypothetical protein PHMEG_00028584 [Phytophthora megakarya]